MNLAPLLAVAALAAPAPNPAQVENAQQGAEPRPDVPIHPGGALMS